MRFLKRVRFSLEWLAVYAFYYLFRSLPLDASTRFGGCLMRLVGRFVKPTRLARKNLQIVFPDWPSEKIETTLVEMWDGYGRIFGEYMHPQDFEGSPAEDRIQVVGAEILETLKARAKPILFVGAHLSNWQMATLAASRYGVPVCQFYRPPNNPWLRNLMRRVQEPFVAQSIPKDSQSLKNLASAFKNGLNLLIFFDQHMHKGIPVPFLGREALTAPTTVRLAKKFDYFLVPFRVERLGGSTFRVTFSPAVDLEQDEYTILAQLNGLLENWVRERPEQWFWVHNRWKGNKGNLR